MAKKKSNFSFGSKPVVRMRRSKFDLSHHVKTMFNAGQLIPFYVQEVYPGDTFKIKSTNVCRTTAPFIRPVMDNMFLDMFYFFVPNRLTFDHWEEVMGENKTGYWKPGITYRVPQISGEVVKGSLADYFGLPLGNISGANPVSVLPFRAYALIWNEWFRDQNTQAPVLVDVGQVGSKLLNGNPWSVNNGVYGMPAPINKLHDYFTSCLPAPQKGDAVDIPLNGFAPVYPSNVELDRPDSYDALSITDLNGSVINTNRLIGTNYNSAVGNSFLANFTASPGTFVGNVVPSNLVADMSVGGIGASVNDFRFAFQLQKMLEKDARGGSRYREMVQEHYGVTGQDSRFQVPEFLGGKRMPLSIQQVNQTSQSSSDSPLAQVGAYSLSNGQCGASKSFVEHGFIIGVMAVRQFHTYQQGVERFWRRTARTDFYDPVFANIGEQPVYTSELYYSSSVSKDQVFGYNEAWADLRFRPSRITGALRSAANDGFDIWHFADEYENAPLLSDQFIRETPAYIDRALSVPSSTAPQFVIDIYNKVDAVHVMPVYSIPGLVDHH